mmetsp:Transcript_1641/g.2523  ORF Transcript_1641/g.2523 Transcript_1641/m.2523 type:complete len:131 (-) Transcript_1641:99-491(-)|eukprot:CAMPEP_0172427464 /NCGR_PEP_ID=MMETSP1064-20121228/42187_1 /TAXON_ID=202472 /ORGANISM="Aulacoseira subarctica , Strain CCAP 1002/5" /LENGTH=130 /DNA_ID=CAMNT_0013171671 /DNA_START=244 /DNA_END=636 /DNA_ORIENTATION=-
MSTLAVSFSLRSSASVAVRVFSTQISNATTTSSCAMEKLRGALNQYRRENYQQETLSRFRKDLMTAAVPGVDFSRSQDYHVNIDTINTILMNIGVPEKMTDDELDTILRDAGVDSKNGRSIPLAKMMSMF